MKSLILSIFIALAMTQIANAQQTQICDIESIPKVKVSVDTRTFSTRTTCLFGSGCSTGKSAQEKAAEEGYTNCEFIGSQSNNLFGTPWGGSQDYVCQKYSEVQLAPDEKKLLLCKKLLSCYVQGLIDREIIETSIKNFNLKCN